jgi:membrane protease YdiL (CAAX protease family)
LLPGIPISALGLFCIAGAAFMLVYRESGLSGVVGLLKRCLDIRGVRNKIWLLPTFLLMPGVMVLSYLVMRFMGVAVPAPQFSLAKGLILFGVLFVAALGEELGWSGYAIDPLQERFGATRGAVLLGLVWATWHVVPLLQVQRSLSFIVWWTLSTVALRVLITWVYNNTGRSGLMAILFHTMANLAWKLFPIDGSYYDPQVTGLITAGVAVLVASLWGPKTLVRGYGT